MTGAAPIFEWSASDLAQAIAAGRVSANEAVEACIARIEAFDPAVNAVVLRRFDEARGEARQADARRAAGEPLGPLHGVPITVKDQFRVEGLPCTLGLEARRSRVETHDGPLVARLRAAGAIVLGKGNVMQLLLGWECENPVFGRTTNPWSVARTPGGSSGGEAAVVAYGGVPVGLGGDFGGSLRVPAAFCGVTTLKPTGGRLSFHDTPSDPYAPQEAILPQPGPIARSVADVALVMRVLAAPGQEQFDLSVPPVPWIEPGAEPLRVGVSYDNGLFPLSPAIRRAIDTAAKALEGVGAKVVPVKGTDGHEALDLFLRLAASDGFRRSSAAVKGQRVSPALKANLQLAAMPGWFASLVGRGMGLAGRARVARLLGVRRPGDPGSYFEALGHRATFRASVVGEWDEAGVDVLLCPATGTPAFVHGASEHLMDSVTYSFAFNVLGFPAGVVPVGFVAPEDEAGRVETGDPADRAAVANDRGSAGMPVAVQIVGRPWEEHRVLAAMQALETALGGPDRVKFPAPRAPSVRAAR